MNNFIIDKERCTKCGLCSAICVDNTITQKGNDFPYIDSEINCKSCGHCIAICPNNAIMHKNMDMKSFFPITNGITGNQLKNFLLSKRSGRHYLDKPVDSTTINKILEVAAMAPTAKNRQWRSFIVLTDREKIRELEKLLLHNVKKMISQLRFAAGTLGKLLIKDPYARELLGFLHRDSEELIKEENREKSLIFYNAPCIIFTYAWHDNGMGGDVFAREHCDYMASYVMLQAHAMGLSTCLIGYASTVPKILQKFLKVPKGYKVYNVITLGYPKYRFRRTVPRKPAYDILWI
ncbi:MAG: nitroreductase family protein [Spirochaetales bacterium]|nr:nitroreductase family protein [Spirochaetales bacterium]